MTKIMLMIVDDILQFTERISIEPCATDFVSDILIFIKLNQTMALRSDSTSSLASFTSEQLDVEDIEEDEELEYHSAPKKKKSREIIPDKCDGVGRLTGEQSPQSSLPSESEEKEQKSREIIPDKCDGVRRLTGEKSP